MFELAGCGGDAEMDELLHLLGDFATACCSFQTMKYHRFSVILLKTGVAYISVAFTHV